MEEAPDDIAFSSGRQDDTPTSSPFTPLLQLWTYHRCDQPDAGPLHLKATQIDTGNSGRATRGVTNNMVKVNNTSNSCIGDMFRPWNNVRDTVRNAKSLNVAKSESNFFC